MSESTANEILIYTREDGTPAINVRLEDETIWVTQAQLVELFQSSKANISEHIANIFEEGELDESATVRKFRTVQIEGAREVEREITHYNLDLVLSVGYRVKSKTATQFRIWATKVLRDYLVKGFAMDDDKLKNLGGGDYWRELLTRIRDIRSSEKVLYRQVLDLYATSIDYSPSAAESKEFFAIIQNKLHFAAHGQT
ncbi:MAG: RhuM family protein, partial [Aurantimicrobium sp.]